VSGCHAVFRLVSVAPKIVAGPRDAAAAVNSDVRLTCAAAAEADPPPAVSWLKDGDPVIPSDYFRLVDGGSLRILGLVASDAGMYQCFAASTAGSTQATAELVVLANGRLRGRQGRTQGGIRGFKPPPNWA